MAQKEFHERVTGGVVGIAGEAHGVGKIDPDVIRRVAGLLLARYPHADFDIGVNYMQGADTIIVEFEPGGEPEADAAALTDHRERIAAIVAEAFAAVRTP